VPEHLHDHPWVYVEVNEQGGTRPARIVDGDLSDSGTQAPPAPPVPRPVEGPRLDRCPVSAGKEKG
jgi:hypothetical protein